MLWDGFLDALGVEREVASANEAAQILSNLSCAVRGFGLSAFIVLLLLCLSSREIKNMTSLDAVLHTSPWVPYNDTLFQSRFVLTYPKNVIFTAQLLSHVQSSDVYDRYPYAETFDVTLFQHVDWQQSLIVIDRHSNVILAPEAVNQLIRLDRRLRYETAAQHIFDPFRFLPFQLFRFQWLGIALMLLLGCAWLSVNGNMKRRLVVSSKVRASVASPRP